MIHIHSH